MKIAEAAAQSGLSTDTIRYYERIGLLAHVARSSDGHRAFTGHDLRWLRMFERLRSTGMPLAQVKRYAQLAREGQGTIGERRTMLEEHRGRLDVQQRQLNDCRALIDEKIENYLRLETSAF